MAGGEPGPAGGGSEGPGTGSAGRPGPLRPLSTSGAGAAERGGGFGGLGAAPVPGGYGTAPALVPAACRVPPPLPDLRPVLPPWRRAGPGATRRRFLAKFPFLTAFGASPAEPKPSSSSSSCEGRLALGRVRGGRRDQCRFGCSAGNCLSPLQPSSSLFFTS